MCLPCYGDDDDDDDNDDDDDDDDDRIVIMMTTKTKLNNVFPLESYFFTFTQTV